MPKQMYFHSIDFSDGKNITVRLGDKWSKNLKTGDIIDVVDVETESICRKVKVTNVETFVFDDLSEDIIKMDHNICCKTKDGLRSELSKIYDKFTPDSIVSVVTFMV